MEATKLKTLVIVKHEVEQLLDINEALEAVEEAFKLKAQGKTIMPAKIYLNAPEYQGDYRAMPAYINGIAGLKWVSTYPNNRQRNLPNVMATIILCDPDTGYPIAIMDGTYITAMRTGVAGGIAAKYLARKNSSVVGMIGAGRQAETQLMATAAVLPKISKVKVFDQYKEIATRYATKMSAKLNVNIHSVETISEVGESDVLVTTTPSRKPVVEKKHIKPGTHINAIGADAKGKQELDPDLLTSAKIIVDDIEQACHSGEINVPLSNNQISVDDIYGTLGEVITSSKKGRENDEEITIFDSTGLAIQDMICAQLVYEKAIKRKLSTYTYFDS
jgi:alanine dehydrogenase